MAQNHSDQALEELLPFYVNHTLTGEEVQAVEAYIASSETAKQEVEYLKMLRQQVQAVNAAATPGELGERRLMRAIKDQQPAPRWWRPAMAAALAAIVLQSVFLLRTLPEDPSLVPLAEPWTRYGASELCARSD